VIEECLTGPEVSVFYLCDGNHAVQLSSAEDHKRIFDGDRGPNTGGMGAIASSPRMTPELAERTLREIVEPVLAGMRAEGEPFIGFLYVSLMLTPNGPRVIEFNVRFGDPEAQVVLPQIEGSFAETLLAAAEGRLSDSPVLLSSDRLVGVVLASRGYPGPVETGQVIEGLDAAAAVPGLTVFHAGTTMKDGRLVTSGGRVLTVVGRGPTFEDAIATAYRGVDAIHFDGMQFRRDIGQKVIQGHREC
jgi:phosphoribosylamine--glycine ligase